MKDILDYSEIVIFPRFKERFGNIMIGMVQLAVFILFFSSKGGEICINYTYEVLTSSYIYVQFLAALIFLIFSFFFFGLLAYLFWQLFGREKITKTTSAIIIERFCILKFEKRIEISDIHHSEYFHVNVRNNFLKPTGTFPFHFGRMKITTKNKKVYCFAYDLSIDEFNELK